MRSRKKNSQIWLVLLPVIFLMGMLYSSQFVLGAGEGSSEDGSNDMGTPVADRRIVETLVTRQWIQDPSFDDVGGSLWASSSEGDESDIVTGREDGEAKIKVKGDKGQFTLDENPPVGDWIPTLNPAFPTFPDTYTLTKEGCEVSHYWAEGADQSPSIHWDKNLSLPVDMADYAITSASLKAMVRGRVKAMGADPNGGEYGIEVPGDKLSPSDQHATYDFVRFYVLVSDVNKTASHEAAYFQTRDLGEDSAGEFDDLPETKMVEVSEENLIFFLTSVLAGGNQFRLTLGMNIWCEDNHYSDDDEFTQLIIKSIKLKFTFEKKIDRFTSLTWRQQGRQINDGVGNVRVENASLNFRYRLNNPEAALLSPNSEIRVLINDNSHTETIKLLMAGLEFRSVKNGAGFDVTNLVLLETNITLAIQLYLADDFELEDEFEVGIDDVTLEIAYTVIETELIEIPPPSDTGRFIFSIYILLGVIGALFLTFGAYQVHFKYPPVIRKVRKMRHKIKHGKKLSSDLGTSRAQVFASQIEKLNPERGKTQRRDPGLEPNSPNHSQVPDGPLEDSENHPEAKTPEISAAIHTAETDVLLKKYESTRNLLQAVEDHFKRGKISPADYSQKRKFIEREIDAIDGELSYRGIHHESHTVNKGNISSDTKPAGESGDGLSNNQDAALLDQYHSIQNLIARLDDQYNRQKLDQSDYRNRRKFLESKLDEISERLEESDREGSN